MDIHQCAFRNALVRRIFLHCSLGFWSFETKLVCGVLSIDLVEEFADG
jgi:hypothetical protein